MIRAIHVEQYGFWWKLSLDEWRAVLQGGIGGNSHELPEARALRRRSPLVGVTNYNDSMARKSYYPLRDDILVYSPLDWETEDYRSALEELEQLTANKTTVAQQAS